MVSHLDDSAEFYTDERCWILETWNDESDTEVSIARARVEQGITTQLHALDVAERYVIVAGKGSVAVGDLAPTSVTVGDAVIIPADTPQRITNTGESDLVLTRHDVTEVSDQELHELFAAYAGPEEPQASQGRRRRGRTMALVVAVLLVLGALTAVLAYRSLGGDSGPTKISAGGFRAIPFPIPMDELIAGSETIFVGTVTDIDGPVELSPAAPPDEPEPVRAFVVSFEVDRVIKGDVQDTIDVTDVVGRGAVFEAEVGQQYVIFAAVRGVGYELVERLVPVGMSQGVFRVTGPNTAENSRGVVIDLQGLRS